MNSILPANLPDVLDFAKSGCRILSLDCFDTLLWRNTHSPKDVFSEVGEHGGTPEQRQWAEINARSRAVLQRNRNEVSLEEIYEAMLPGAPMAAVQAAVQAEITAEVSNCFAFAPTVELIKKAKSRGLKVIIVSDTYLSKKQLIRLIGEAAGKELIDNIDEVFCSSEYGVSKNEGLFRHVLRRTAVTPQAILHVGDNRNADFVAPQILGIPAVHLLQFSDEAQQRLRLEATLSAMLHTRGKKLAAHQPHRAALALYEPSFDDCAGRLGFSVVGPLMWTFAAWLQNECVALQKKSGGDIHMLFLMRDGFLPLQVLQSLPDVRPRVGVPVEISRFTATAASFVDKEGIDRFLEREAGSGELRRLSAQLLFDPAESAALAPTDKADTRGKMKYLRDVRRPANIEKILERSSAMAARLVQHIRSRVPVKPGDTLVLVDLGYNGSVQNSIGAILEQALQVNVAGRYLLLREQEVSGLDKKGMFDRDNYDFGTIEALCGSVNVLEQLCTLPQGSVVDYDADGNPLRTEAGVKSHQVAVRARVQEACVLYAKKRRLAHHSRPSSDTLSASRQAAAAILSRLLFLPMPSELEALSEFEHDVNLGTEEMVPLFDRGRAADALKEQGMFYMKGANRMFLPAEIRGQGLPLSLALFAQRRFSLDLRRSDFQDSVLQLPVIVANGRDVIAQDVPAHPTHDGFLSAVIPVGDYAFAIGVQFGRLYEWVEVLSAEFVPAQAFEAGQGAIGDEPRQANVTLEGLELVAGNLLRCADKSAFLMVPPPGPPCGRQMVLRVTFRPIVFRSPTSVGSSSNVDDHAGLAA